MFIVADLVSLSAKLSCWLKSYMLAGKALASLHIAQVYLSLCYSTKSECTDEPAVTDPEGVQVVRSNTPLWQNYFIFMASFKNKRAKWPKSLTWVCLKLTYRYLLKSGHVPGDTWGGVNFGPGT